MEKNPNFKYKVILGDGSCILNFAPETFAGVDPQLRHAAGVAKFPPATALSHRDDTEGNIRGAGPVILIPAGERRISKQSAGVIILVPVSRLVWKKI